MSLAEANKLARGYLEQGRQALPSGVQLADPYGQEGVTCSGSRGDDTEERVFSSRDAELVNLGSMPVRHYFTALRAWWKKNRFRIIHDAQKTGYILAENTDDGFRMDLQANKKGKLYLGVSSPCVWRNGTPE